MISLVEINGKRMYEVDGKVCPSASSVLDVLFPMSTGFISEEALVRGSRCHAMTAEVLVKIATTGKNSSDWPGEEEDGARARQAVEYVKEHVSEIIAVESPMHFMGIGMTPDLIGIKKSGKTVVFDHKFAESISERYAFQLELYCRAAGADEGCLIQVTRKGAKPNIHKIELDDRRWMLIRSAINVVLHLQLKEKRL